MQRLTQARVRAALAGLKAGPFSANVHVFERVGSTNDVARQMAEDQAPEGTLILAEEQTAGRGRMGRTWYAPPGTSLLMSVVFRPAFAPEQAHRLVMACGLAVAEACEGLLDVAVGVKWPNDLVLGGRKVGGILLENAITGDALLWAVVGMGVNVNQTFEGHSALSETATSLKLATGRECDRLALLRAIVAGLHHWHSCLHGSGLVEEWRRRCVTLDQRVRVGGLGGMIIGWAEDIDDNGALLLRDEAGRRHAIFSGEATLLTE